MKLKTLFSLLLLAILSACSSNDEKKEALKAADLVDFDETVKVKKLWSRSLGSGRDKRYSRFSPAISEDSIYVSDVDGRVFAVDKDKGKLRWKTKLKKTDLSSGVGYAGNNLYVGTYDGELIALSKDNGDVLWKAKASSEILAVPVANTDVVVVQTIDGRLFGFDAKTGEQRWRYDHQVPSLTMRGLADPVMTRTQLISAFGNGQIVVLNPEDGAQLWNARVSQPKGVNELERVVDVDGSPIVKGGNVYAAAYQGAIAAFSQVKGGVVWKRDLSTIQNLSASNSKVFAVTEESHVVAYNLVNGNVEWINDQTHRRDLSAPLAYDDYVLAIDDDGYLHLMSAADGSFAYRFKPSGSGFSAKPISYDDRFLLLSDDGKLSAYSLSK